MNYITTKDLKPKQIEEIFRIADRIKGKREAYLANLRPVLALLFEKPSTRTRVSFEAAMSHLGGTSIAIDSKSSQLSRGESIADTARVLSLYVDVIAARMFKQSDIEELAQNSKVPVINALTDLEHPCQALSDIYTVREILGRVKGVRIAFVGDIATNTANSLMSIGAKSGANMVLVGPKDCKPNKTFIGIAKKYSSVFVYNDMKRGLRGCDVVYTDTFVSMGEEAEAAQRRKRFAPYQLNSKTVGYAKKGAKIMHCLPAHRGEEITSQVMDGKDSIILQQSANKLLLEKAILLYLLKK